MTIIQQFSSYFVPLTIGIKHKCRNVETVLFGLGHKRDIECYVRGLLNHNNGRDIGDGKFLLFVSYNCHFKFWSQYFLHPFIPDFVLKILEG